MNWHEVGQWVSIGLQAAAVVIGLLAAWHWYRSAKTLDPVAAASWNGRAALTTAIAVALQGVALAIDLWAHRP
jgi:hypothetical protein